jgi:hypothetical protein
MRDAILTVIDVPALTADAVPFEVAFGAVAVPNAVLLTNKNPTPMGVRTNGAEADEFQLGAGESLLVMCPTAAGLTALSVTTTDTQDGDASVEYVIFGD